MRWLLLLVLTGTLVAGCGGSGTGADTSPDAGSRGGFGRRESTLAAISASKTTSPASSAQLRKAPVIPERPTPTTPASASSFIGATLEEAAPDLSWVTAKWEPRGDAKPVIGDWAAVVDRWPADNTNRLLSRKRDCILAWGRVLEVSAESVKIVLDRMHSQPRLEKGQLVLIRWY